MPSGHHLILIEPESRRRAAISHLLGGGGVHVEPFEDVAELASRWPSDGVIFIYDSTGAVAELVHAMSRTMKWLPLVAYAEDPGTSRVVHAVTEGASDYLAWPFTVAEANRALTAAQNSHAALGTLRLREANARSRIQRLTPREREVLTGVASGLSNRLIGEQLSISPRTVEIHRANMLTKIGANHTSEAIRIAIEAALVR